MKLLTTRSDLIYTVGAPSLLLCIGIVIFVPGLLLIWIGILSLISVVIIGVRSFKQHNNRPFSLEAHLNPAFKHHPSIEASSNPADTHLNPALKRQPSATCTSSTFKLPNTVPPKLTWIGTLSVQFALFFVTLAFFANFPQMVLIQPASHTLHARLNEWAVYAAPLAWPIITLVSTLISNYRYRQHKDAWFSQLVYPLTRSTPTDLVGIIANTDARLGTTAFLSGLMFLMSIILSQWLFHASTHLIRFPGPAWLISLVLMAVICTLLIFSGAIKHFTYWLNHQETPLLIQWIIIMAVLGLLIGTALTTFALIRPTAQIPQPQWLKWLLLQSMQHAVFLLPVLFSIATVPLISCWMAYRAHCATPRQLVIQCLTVPALLTLFIAIVGPTQLLQVYHYPNFQPIINTLGLISIVLLFAILTQRAMRPSVVRSYLPYHIKPRNIVHTVQAMFRMTLILLMFYCLFQMTGLNVLFTFCTFFLLLFLTLTVIVAIRYPHNDTSR